MIGLPFFGLKNILGQCIHRIVSPDTQGLCEVWEKISDAAQKMMWLGSRK